MSHNPERRAWKGRSYKKGGRPVRELRAEAEESVAALLEESEAHTPESREAEGRQSDFKSQD
jgi:hypothetical protein